MEAPVLVFYEPSPFDFDPGYPHRTMSGFYAWYYRLVQALRALDVDVRVNDREFAMRHPHHPVGIVGHRNIMERWELPNPTVLGPSLYDHPREAAHVLDDPRFRSYLVTAEWFRRLFVPLFGDRCVMWYAGIDTDAWAPDGSVKDLDFLIYDKIRYDRDRRAKDLVAPIHAELAARGYSSRVLRYGNHSHAEYRDLLMHASAMLLLTEMETQGMAYQEALACDVPVLAWDPGYWLDPKRELYEATPVQATSVPYFSADCGERFVGPDDFTGRLDDFAVRLTSYRPRDYVLRHLSLAGSARRYLNLYSEAAG